MDEQKKIELLMENDTFVEKLKSKTSFEEVAALFEEEGITVSAEDLRLAANESDLNGELKEDALDKVAGGIVVASMVAKKFAKIIVPIIVKAIKKAQQDPSKW